MLFDAHTASKPVRLGRWIRDRLKQKGDGKHGIHPCSNLIAVQYQERHTRWFHTNDLLEYWSYFQLQNHGDFHNITGYKVVESIMSVNVCSESIFVKPLVVELSWFEEWEFLGERPNNSTPFPRRGASTAADLAIFGLALTPNPGTRIFHTRILNDSHSIRQSSADEWFRLFSLIQC